MSSEDMNLSVNGHSKVPPGFRFHPTEEELIHYYLRKKVAGDKIDLDVIRDVDLNKLEPWDIQEKCKIGTTPQNDWYIFSHKDKKYPTGTRTNRATAAGFWKATGRDKAIQSNCRRIGMRKTLVFYGGRAPHGQKSDWIMHEYRLDDNQHSTNVSSFGGGAADTGAEEGWVVCRVFKKKNYHRALKSPIQHNDTVLDNLIKHMGKSSSSSSSFCKEEIEQFSNPAAGFLHLPELDSPSINHPSSNISDEYNLGFPELMQEMEATRPSRDWVAMDRLVASQLNGQPPVKFSGDDDDFAFSFDDHVQQFINMNNNPETWNYGRLLSAADPLCHLSV